MELKNDQVIIFYYVASHYSANIEQSLKQLIEEKHLYQSLIIPLPDANDVFNDAQTHFSVVPEQRKSFKATCDLIHAVASDIDWHIRNPFDRLGGYAIPDRQKEIDVSLEVSPPPIKVYCQVCKRVEAYNFLHGTDLLAKTMDFAFRKQLEHEQIFALSYQCQSCKSIPEVFLIRRSHNKLTLSGRTPMEFVPVPKFIPKRHKKYFSDAVIAFNSGQILAAKSLLRTFLEQYVRSIAADPDTRDIESLFYEYNDKLPNDFKQRFPSLKAIYYQLSEDIHAADASSESFEQAKQQIEKHFDAKRVYEIPNYPTTT